MNTKTVKTFTMDLSGNNYEIGMALGKAAANIGPLKALHTQGMEGFGEKEVKEAKEMFERYCPGLNEELAGFADAVSARPEQMFYTAMTYLLPRCSHIACLPKITADSKPLIARNYEFSHEAEDFTLVRTSVKGKYTHLGTSVISFGRDDGLNEHGLSVTQSSYGFPVGALPFMRNPALKGLQFWAVIRGLLENCKDVSESLEFLKDIPIAYNINLLLADKSGHAALYETFDGIKAYKEIGPDTEEQFIYATNHALLKDIIPYEPEIMVHSKKRADYIENCVKNKTGIDKEYLKNMLLSMYPQGLCCHFFEEYFGTTKSMVISPAEGTIEICWGGRVENGFKTYSVNEALEYSVNDKEIILDKGGADIFGYQKRQ